MFLPAHPLGHLGWDSALEVAMAPHAATGTIAGRVVRVDRGLVSVLTAAATLRVPIAGRLLDALPEGGITAGDWVCITSGMAVAALPRRTVFLRRAAGERTAAQAVAANVDTALLTVPLGAGARPRRLERLLAVAWASGATPIAVLTKADLSADLATDLDLAREAAGAAVVVVAVSAVGATGLDTLSVLLEPGRTAAMIGPSGAGKSTLVNLLAGAAGLATAPVRDDGRGRHTTTARHLLVLPSGVLIVDTPGLRELGVWDATDGIASAFGDIAELAAGCRFSDCAHDAEPGCAVRAAAVLDPAVLGRLASQRKLAREQRWVEVRQDGRARAEGRRVMKRHNRALRREQPR
ncbi:MAG TPA: ribosome small subunit-dependent GTPase A [Candidatus Dormibacteraeota bacterium]